MADDRRSFELLSRAGGANGGLLSLAGLVQVGVGCGGQCCPGSLGRRAAAHARPPAPPPSMLLP